MSKTKLIIFEGVDGVGKTTIYQAFRKATTYHPLCIDRFLGSNFAYDTFFKRKDSIDIQDYFETEHKLMEIFDCILVYLTCEWDTLIRRIRNHDEESLKLDPIKRIQEVDLLFYFYFKMSGFRKIMIDTSYRTVRGTVDIIVRFMNSNVRSKLFLSETWKKGLEIMIERSFNEKE